jgi:hypothetical protein
MDWCSLRRFAGYLASESPNTEKRMTRDFSNELVPEEGVEPSRGVNPTGF